MERTSPTLSSRRMPARTKDERLASISTSSHRDAAREALAEAQRNPIMSAEQYFAVAQVHALLAIEERLAELVTTDRHP